MYSIHSNNSCINNTPFSFILLEKGCVHNLFTHAFVVNSANRIFHIFSYNKINKKQHSQKERILNTMEMTLRWYGSSFDTVTLKQIRQIPGVTGVITTLYDTAPGEVWSRERIHAMKEDVEANGLHVSGIESVNVHDAIKIGNKDRDFYINNYIETLENLGKEDIHLVCYNFMPVFDWTRTELARKRPDGSTVLAYTQAAVDALNPEDMFHSISS